MPKPNAYAATTGPSLFDRITTSLSITPDQGIPHVDHLPNDLIRQDDHDYMRRYFLLGRTPETPGSKARYHQILQSDRQDLHDHPWDFISIILNGTYVETTPDDERAYGPGTVLVRKAEQLHRLTLHAGPVWTFVLVSPARRRWGYHTCDGWVHWSTYHTTTRHSR